MDSVYIAGTGDLAREVLHTIREQTKSGRGKDTVRGFLDPIRSGKESFEGLPVVGIDSLTGSLAETMHCIIGIGKPSYIQNAQRMMIAKGVRNWVNAIHPRAYLAPGVQLGKGVYVAAHATIAIAASICDFCVINQNVSVGHDAVIGQHAVISPGCIVSGRCELAPGVFLGSGAVLFPGVKVGVDSQISANCVISKDVPDRMRVMSVARNMELPI